MTFGVGGDAQTEAVCSNLGAGWIGASFRAIRRAAG